MQNERYPTQLTKTEWTCMGSIYSHTVKYAYKKFVEHRKLQSEKGISGSPMAWADVELDMCKFVQGVHDNWFSKAWLYCDFVYGIENIAGAHWGAYAYSLKEKVVYVYDSMAETYEDERRDIFDMHAAIAPSLYNEACVHDEDKYDIDIPFKVKHVDVPQQKNGFDCGVYAIKFIQCLAMNANFSELRPEYFPYYRKKLACDLLKWTMKGEKIIFHEQALKV